MREARFRRFAGLELFPQFEEARAMGVGKQAKDAFDRDAFRRLALGEAFLRVDDGVAGVDLADVVHQQHRDDVLHVE